MSADTPQDRELEQLLADTAALRRQYRGASREEPPAQLDEAIRAAARKHVRARPHPAGSRLGTSWRIPASIAAVVVVSVTLTVMVAQHDSQLPVAREQPAPPPALGAEAPKDQAEAAPVSDALKQAARPDPEKSAAQDRPQAARPPASSDAPAATAVEKRERSVTPEGKTPIAPAGVASRGEPTTAEAPAKPTAPATTPAAAAGANFSPAQPTLQEGAAKATAEGTLSAQPLAKRHVQASPAEADSGSPWEKDPQAWLQHIEELRAAGRTDDAAVSFRTFRSRYPDYRLPAGFVAPRP